MGVNYFIFNGESSLDHGVYVGGQGTFNAPQRDVSKISVPGRNGDLIKDNGRWMNIQVPYNIVIMKEFLDRTGEISAWLNEPKSYERLEDTYHPDSFRLARFSSPIEFETAAFNNAGRATITFDCKPQRFLKSGEALLPQTKNTMIYNPTRYPSKPLIRAVCTGSGTVTVGLYTITLSNIPTYVDIDSEIQDCSAEGLSLNNKVSLSNGFPLLMPKGNIVTWTGDVTDVSIAGRWFTI